MVMRVGVVMSAAASSAILWCVPCVAGPITPPPGPVAGTGKTLVEMQPRVAINATNTPGTSSGSFRITEPGSYYLTGNITGVSGVNGIEIKSSGVTIDLMGFALLGVAGSGHAIVVQGTASDLAIRNGTISGWGGNGISLGEGGAEGATHVLLEGLAISLNGASGITAGRGTIVRDCVVRDHGAHGISLPVGGSVINCVAFGNDGYGILVGRGGAVLGCAARENGATGIKAGELSIVDGCSVLTNGGRGVEAGANSSVTDCVSRDNVSDGISVATGSTVSGCSASVNDGHGISAAGACAVIRNACDSNGAAGSGAGVFVSGSQSRVDGNNCTDNDWGIRITTGFGNIIVQNTCSGNTTLNWDIAAGNKCLVVAGVDAGAISGDFGGVSPGSTNPWANFSY